MNKLFGPGSGRAAGFVLDGGGDADPPGESCLRNADVLRSRSGGNAGRADCGAGRAGGVDVADLEGSDVTGRGVAVGRPAAGGGFVASFPLATLGLGAIIVAAVVVTTFTGTLALPPSPALSRKIELGANAVVLLSSAPFGLAYASLIL